MIGIAGDPLMDGLTEFVSGGAVVTVTGMFLAYLLKKGKQDSEDRKQQTETLTENQKEFQAAMKEFRGSLRTDSEKISAALIESARKHAENVAACRANSERLFEKLGK